MKSKRPREIHTWVVKISIRDSFDTSLKSLNVNIRKIFPVIRVPFVVYERHVNAQSERYLQRHKQLLKLIRYLMVLISIHPLLAHVSRNCVWTCSVNVWNRSKKHSETQRSINQKLMNLFWSVDQREFRRFNKCYRTFLTVKS